MPKLYWPSEALALLEAISLQPVFQDGSRPEFGMPPKLPEIIDAAVEDDAEAEIRINHRLR
jgi:hypothetical protein